MGLVWQERHDCRLGVPLGYAVKRSAFTLTRQDDSEGARRPQSVGIRHKARDDSGFSIRENYLRPRVDHNQPPR